MFFGVTHKQVFFQLLEHSGPLTNSEITNAAADAGDAAINTEGSSSGMAIAGLIGAHNHEPANAAVWTIRAQTHMIPIAFYQTNLKSCIFSL